MKRFASLAIQGLLAVLLAGCSSDEPAPARIAEGHPFPQLTLQRATGEPVSTASFRGRLVVLNVWATWCPPCRKEMPSLDALSRRLDPSRFAVVGLSTDGDALLAEEFLRGNGIRFPNFHDRDAAIAKRYHLDMYPETFLIAPDGVLIGRVTGMREWDSDAMVALLEDAWAARGAVATKTAVRQ